MELQQHMGQLGVCPDFDHCDILSAPVKEAKTLLGVSRT
jgi:hypothetical protein